MKVVKTNRTQADNIMSVVDEAYGWPRLGTQLSGQLPPSAPRTWDKTGPTPPGWTKTQYETYELNPGDVWVPVEDDAASVVQGSAVSAARKAIVSGVLASRVDVSDPTEGKTRTPKASAAAAVRGQTAAKNGDDVVNS